MPHNNNNNYVEGLLVFSYRHAAEKLYTIGYSHLQLGRLRKINADATIIITSLRPVFQVLN